MPTAPATPERPRAPTFYQNYILRENEYAPSGLLGLQTPYGKGTQAHPDELLFIAIHQTYELWFKVMIDEVLRKGDGVVARIDGGNYPDASRSLRRLTRITNILREQYSIVETISPTDFLVFRDVLRPSSGYDSSQFRALELASGLRQDRSYLAHLCGAKAARSADPEALAKMAGNAAEAVHAGRDAGLREYSVMRKLASTGDVNGLRLLERALGSRSLRDAAYRAIQRAAGGAAPAPWVKATAKEWDKAQKKGAAEGAPSDAGISATEAAQGMHKVAAMYRAATTKKLDPRARTLFDLVEALVEYDEAFRNLRTIHINMVLRVIGGRPGTGGSTGAAYLRSTLDYEFFPLLWRARDNIDGP
jgi:tryptophan 2,3-dioxygenase